MRTDDDLRPAGDLDRILSHLGRSPQWKPLAVVGDRR
jgi:hypothetical protein